MQKIEVDESSQLIQQVSDKQNKYKNSLISSYKSGKYRL